MFLPQVLWSEQQVSKRRKKRDVYQEPSDPKFRDQWYLVSRSTDTAFNKKPRVFPLCLSETIQDLKLIEPLSPQSE